MKSNQINSSGIEPTKKYVSDCPHLVVEWNFEKNIGKPEDFTSGLDTKVWWICKNGHEWFANIHNRFKNNRGCPVCSGQKILTGYNDLASLNPELAAQWHKTKNILSPQNVSPRSGKNFWWICKEGHEWEASPHNRSAGAGHCPICINRKILIGYNDLATLNPELAQQWHPTKNDTTPNKVSWKSNKKIWWICEKGHEWDTKIASRTKGDGCPICVNQKILKGYNDLATLNPDLAQQWHPTKNNITPDKVSSKSNKKYWWICKEGHEWEATVANRSARRNCPICSGKKILTGYNDLATLNPELAKEWHPIKNNTTPDKVALKSHKYAWWICKKGHEWKTIIKNRCKHSCPLCNESKGEKFLYEYLDEIHNNITVSRQHRDDNIKNIRELPFDFALYKDKSLIGYLEFNGEQHYIETKFSSNNEFASEVLKEQQNRDQIKINKCKELKIPLLILTYKQSKDEMKKKC